MTRVKLGQLVSNSALFLEISELPDAWEGRAVAGAHVVEISEPGRWILPDWVMLTTGLRVDGDATAQRRLVREVASAEACALIYGTFDDQHIPPAVRKEAKRVGLPLLRAPESSSFSEIIQFVHELNASDAAHTFNRLASLQRFLLDAFGEPRPAAVIVERLSSFLSMPVIVFDGTGQAILASHAIAEQDAVFEVLRSGSEDGRTISDSVGELEIMAVPVPGVDGQAYWLTVVKRGSLAPASFLRSSLQLAAPMLVATDRLGAAERASEEATSEAFLEEILAADRDSNLDELTARAAVFGIDFEGEFRVVFSHSNKQGFGPAWRRGARRALLHEGMPHLIREDASGVVLVVPIDNEEVQSLFDAALEDDPDLWLGIGRPLRSVLDAAESLRDAKLAARPTGRRRPRQRIRRYEDLDLPSLLMSDAKAERVSPSVEKLLGGLEENAILLETLTTYFDCDCDVRRAARRIQLHENTVRYRLTRVEKLVGSSLRDPATIATLYLALLAREVEPAGPQD